jgi:hypothetical protein
MSALLLPGEAVQTATTIATTPAANQGQNEEGPLRWVELRELEPLTPTLPGRVDHVRSGSLRSRKPLHLRLEQSRTCTHNREQRYCNRNCNQKRGFLARLMSLREGFSPHQPLPAPTTTSGLGLDCRPEDADQSRRTGSPAGRRDKVRQAARWSGQCDGQDKSKTCLPTIAKERPSWPRASHCRQKVKVARRAGDRCVEEYGRMRRHGAPSSQGPCAFKEEQTSGCPRSARKSREI